MLLPAQSSTLESLVNRVVDNVHPFSRDSNPLLNPSLPSGAQDNQGVKAEQLASGTSLPSSGESRPERIECPAMQMSDGGRTGQSGGGEEQQTFLEVPV
jgi:hypothetical protein